MARHCATCAKKSYLMDRKLAMYYLMTQTGLRPDFDFAKLAVNKYGIIKKSGAWFSVCDPTTGEILEEDGKPVKLNGMAKVYEYLQANPEYYDVLVKFILDDINADESAEGESDMLSDVMEDND